jgi:hypothetical protein
VAKVKGTNLIGAVKFLRRHKEQARRALAAPLHHYLEERILPTSWYPEEDLVALVRAMAPLFGELSADAFEQMGRAAVREHMEGVYEHLLKGDRLTLARRVSALWQTQHDTGRLSLVPTGRGRARYELADYGHPSREMCATIRGYLLEALERSGFAGVEIEKTRCVLDGAERCVWECRWQATAGA